MLVLVLCHFHSSVVNSLVVQLEINSESRAEMPVVVWRCRFGIREIFKCAIAPRNKAKIASKFLEKAISIFYKRKQRLGSRSYKLKQKTPHPLLAICTLGRLLLLPTSFYADPKNTYSKGQQGTAVLDCQAAFSGLTLAKYCSIAALTRSGTEQFFSSAKDCSCSLISGYTTAFTCADSGLSLP